MKTLTSSGWTQTQGNNNRNHKDMGKAAQQAITAGKFE